MNMSGASERNAFLAGSQLGGARKHLGRRSLHEELSFAHDRNSVAEVCEVVHIVGHHHHGEPLFVQVGHHVENRFARLRVEPCGGLVEHEHLRLHSEHARERYAALLAARELEGAARGDFLGVKPHGAQGALDPRGDLLFRKAQVARPKGDIFRHGCREELVLGVLEHHADAPAHVVGGALLRDIAPEGDDAAVCGVQDAVHVLDEGGLARAGMAGDAQELAFAHFEGHVVERPERFGGISPFSLFGG